MTNTTQQISASRKVFIFLGFFTACLFFYFPIFDNGFLLDENIVIFGEHGLIHKPFPALFFELQNTFYRPVGHIYLWVLSRLSGADPFGYHVGTFLLFVAIVFSLYRLVHLWSGRRDLALTATLLYAAHPMQNGLVNYSTLTLMGTYILALQWSFIFFIQDVDLARGKNISWRSVLLLIAALLCHEVNIAFPIFIFGYMFFIRRCRQWKELLKGCAPYLIVVFFYLVFRFTFFSLQYVVNRAAIVVPQPGVYLATISDLFAWYFSRLVWPQDILFLWSVPLAKDFILPTVFGFLGVIGLLTLIFIRMKGLVPFSLVLLCGGSIPVFVACFAHYPFAQPFIEPHWFAFSVIGYFVILAYGLILMKDSLGRIPYLIATVLLVIISLWHLQKINRYWQDQESYCRHWINLNPINISPFHGLGRSLIHKEQFAEAESVFAKGAEINGYPSPTYVADWGYALFRQGKLRQAKNMYMEVLQKQPDYSVIHAYLAEYFVTIGQIEQAKTAIQTALQLYPENEKYQKFMIAIENSEQK